MIRASTIRSAIWSAARSCWSGRFALSGSRFSQQGAWFRAGGRGASYHACELSSGLRCEASATGRSGLRHALGRRRPNRWIALIMTSAGIFFHRRHAADNSPHFHRNLHISTAGLSGQILTVVLMRPTQLALLVMGIFYLWIYLRRESERG